MKNVFVIGLDTFNLGLLEGINGPETYQFHALLSYEDAVRPDSGRIDFDHLLRNAEARLLQLEGPVDAVIGYWDFPTSALVPMLQGKLGLPAPSLEAVAQCEHKYWARCAQSEVLNGMVPRFAAVDPFADDPLGTIDLAYPFWIKPVKAHSSYLGFEIGNADDFRHAAPIIRENIPSFGDAFNAFLKRVKVAPEVAHVGGNWCVAEKMISVGAQCTLEGYADADEVEVYGVIDSIREGARQSCFARYQYPSRLPDEVQSRMTDAAVRLIRHIGYRNAPFNMEFYWNPDTDRIWLLEINARLSKSHGPLFKLVDGETHLKIAIDLALGQTPWLPRREGAYPVAGKFMMRVFTDSMVRRIPTASELDQVEEVFPEVMIRLMVEEGQRLSHLLYQDSYSFEIAEVFIGAANEEELLAKYDAVRRLLHFEFSSLNEVG